MKPKRFKVKIIAKGFTQTEGVDFTEVFSLIVRHASIKIIFSLATVNKMHLEQMDVKIIFLCGELQEEVIMTQPEGFMDPMRAEWACLLNHYLVSSNHVDSGT